MDEIEKIILKTIGHEGSYVNDPQDAGGETNWGISKRSYPEVDIKNLTKEQAIEIYKRDYYFKLEVPMDWSVQIRWKLFDIAVNMGLMTAKRFKEFIKDNPDINGLVQLQINRYVDITVAKPTNLKFLKGWVNRAFDKGTDLA